jgi:kumamolisin
VKPKFYFSRILRLLAVPCLIALTIWIFQKDDLFSFFSHPVVLSGSVPEIVHKSQQIQHADAGVKMEIVVGLKTRNDIELDGLIARQQDPNSRDYQRFLSVEEFTQHFAPTQSQVDDVVKFLTLNGITVEEVYPNRLLIRASGSVTELERAFKVTINEYQLPSASTTTMSSTAALTTYFSNDRDPSIPAALNDVVQSVIGLNTLAAYHSHIMHDDRASPTPHGQTPVSTAPGQMPVAAPPGKTAQPPVAPSPFQTPDVPLQTALTPQDIATAYNFPNANNKKIAPRQRKYGGKGVNLAIITAFAYDHAEVEAYWKAHGVVRHGSITDTAIGKLGAELGDETTLDLELAGAQAPDANILMYIAALPMNLFFAVTFNKVVSENKADVVTVSWGTCEDRAGARLMANEATALREAAVQGIALFASAGDDGAYDCGSKTTPPVLAVDYPSSSPYVTAVGGTSLILKNGQRASETVWKKSGGGVSSSINTPLWQVAPTLPPGNMRATTDVSLDADPRTGYSYLFKGKWERIGGTSAAAPTWAALWALVLQSTGQRVGSANNYVYRMGSLKEYHSLFYDVTHGSNGIDVGPGYSAGPGWDIPSGWGTPNGAAITDWMIQVSPVKAPEDKSLGQKHPQHQNNKAP